MSKSKILVCTLAMLFSLSNFSMSFAEDASPANGIAFQLPIQPGTTTSAILLRAPSDQLYLVYSLPTGKIGLWTMTNSGNSPQPTPTPPNPPSRPLAAIITVTDDVPSSLPPQSAAYAAERSIAYFAYTIAMVATDTPPPNALAWIGKTANHDRPYTFLADAEGKILWQGETPITDAAFLSTLKTLPKQKPRKPNCTTGTCPFTWSPKP